LNDFFQINGKNFSAGVVKLERTAEKLDKYAERTIDGDLKRELIGTYINYRIGFGDFDDPIKYDELYTELIRPVEFVTVKFPFNKGCYIFRGYIAEVKDTIIFVKGSKRTFEGPECSIVTKLPTWRARNARGF
jgi:hypothetical protein